MLRGFFFYGETLTLEFFPEIVQVADLNVSVVDWLLRSGYQCHMNTRLTVRKGRPRVKELIFDVTDLWTAMTWFWKYTEKHRDRRSGIKEDLPFYYGVALQEMKARRPEYLDLEDIIPKEKTIVTMRGCLAKDVTAAIQDLKKLGKSWDKSIIEAEERKFKLEHRKQLEIEAKERSLRVVLCIPRLRRIGTLADWGTNYNLNTSIGADSNRTPEDVTQPENIIRPETWCYGMEYRIGERYYPILQNKVVKWVDEQPFVKTLSSLDGQGQSLYPRRLWREDEDLETEELECKEQVPREQLEDSELVAIIAAAEEEEVLPMRLAVEGDSPGPARMPPIESEEIDLTGENNNAICILSDSDDEQDNLILGEKESETGAGIVQNSTILEEQKETTMELSAKDTNQVLINPLMQVGRDLVVPSTSEMEGEVELSMGTVHTMHLNGKEDVTTKKNVDVRLSVTEENWNDGGKIGEIPEMRELLDVGDVLEWRDIPNELYLADLDVGVNLEYDTWTGSSLVDLRVEDCVPEVVTGGALPFTEQITEKDDGVTLCISELQGTEIPKNGCTETIGQEEVREDSEYHLDRVTMRDQDVTIPVEECLHEEVSENMAVTKVILSCSNNTQNLVEKEIEENRGTEEEERGLIERKEKFVDFGKTQGYICTLEKTCGGFLWLEKERWREHVRNHFPLLTCQEPGCEKKGAFSTTLWTHCTKHTSGQDFGWKYYTECLVCTARIPNAYGFLHLIENHAEELDSRTKRNVLCGDCAEVAEKSRSVRPPTGKYVHPLLDGESRQEAVVRIKRLLALERKNVRSSGGRLSKTTKILKVGAKQMKK